MAPLPALVVGVDGSGHADPAVLAAFHLAGALGLQVELVHAAEVPHPLWQHVDAERIAEARKATLARLSTLLTQAGIAPPALEKHLHVVPGPPARALLGRAKELSAALLALGRHVDQGLFQRADTVRAVVAHSDCPVWVQSGPWREVRRILVPIDLSAESLKALGIARDHAARLGASLEVLHVFVRPELGFVLGYPVPFPTSVVDSARETAEREFAAALAGYDWRGVPHGQRFTEGDPAHEILTLHREFDLVVMGTHGRTGLTSAILGSVAAAVLADTERPVLAIREAARAWSS